MTEILYKKINESGPEIAAKFDIAALNSDFYENPYPVYHALRRHYPVHKMESGGWFLTRYQDIDRIYHDPVTFSSDKKEDFRKTMGNTALYEHHTSSLVFNDPPKHTSVRKRLAPAFAPRAVRELKGRVKDVVKQTIHNVAGMKSFDLVHDFAMKLPIELIADMLGVPQADRSKLSPWAVAILSGLEANLSLKRRNEAARAVEEFKEYLKWLIAEKKKKPMATANGEVLYKLIGPDENGNSLTELDLLHNCIFLLNAGHETTANTVTNCIDMLVNHPEQLAHLRAESDLISGAVEETLRFESPVQLSNRKLTSDAEIGGVQMVAGDYIWLCIGAANRDPKVFYDPDVPNIRRRPNKHLAFGSGIHACAGMSLGRMEAEIALNAFVQSFTKIESSSEAKHYRRARFRGFKRYPVIVSP